MSPQRKKISILGSTGTIGVKGIKIALDNPERFEVVGLAANNNIDLLAEQIKELKPKLASVGDKEAALKLRNLVSNQKVEIVYGEKGLIEVAGMNEPELVLSAVSGFAGLVPTLEAVKKGKTVALSNKESLVVGGDLVMTAARKSGSVILPVDSEHSAIFQSLQGSRRKDLKKIILTASGGPFFQKTREELKLVNSKQALNHPNWQMGKKVTIDSATLMNKGLEMIEAVRLFEIAPSDIEIIIHPQSIIHSAVEFTDGSIIAQMSIPDMTLPISYAMTYPERIELKDIKRLDLIELGQLTFLAPDKNKFPNLRLAFEAVEMGGTAPAVLNGADEIAVDAFLDGKIEFMEISLVIEKVLNKHKPIEIESVETVVTADNWARREAVKIVNTIGKK